MNDSFFTRPGKESRKRKRGTREKPPRGLKGRKRKEKADDSSIDSDIADANEDVDSLDGSDELAIDETAAERRLRLAKTYLDNVRGEILTHGFDAEDVDRETIAQRLQEDVAEEKGRVYRFIAGRLDVEHPMHIKFAKQSSSVTAVAASFPYVYTCTKKGGLQKWDIRGPKPTKVLYAMAGKATDKAAQGHQGPILCAAASSDGKFVVTGGQDGRIIVWNAELTLLRVFRQHRGPVLGLTIRRGTNQLYSCAADRTVKLWSLNELTYVETLFGHQDAIASIASLAQERCLTCGSRDRTARLWKIIDETQLVFQSKPSKGALYSEGSMDCVAMLDEQHFVTGSDNGNVSLWSLQKKKPLFTLPMAHGCDDALPLDLHTAEQNGGDLSSPPVQARWVTSLVALAYSNLFFSASWNAGISVWEVHKDMKSFQQIARIPIAKGVVNSMCVVEEGNPAQQGVALMVGIGRETRLGRWSVFRDGRSTAELVKINIKPTSG